MIIDKLSSERLRILRFPLIVGVVFIHAYGTEIGLAGGTVGVENTGYLAEFVRNLVSQGISRVAVPLFFLMSGYFFFLGFSWSIENYGDKIKSRIRTLLIPFLFWNIAVLIFLAVAQKLPATQVYFSGSNLPIADYTLWDFINKIFGITGYPISYPFWFIRDLMVMVLFAPLVYFLLKKAPRVFLGVILAVWLLNLWPLYIPSIDAVAFFYVGAYFAQKNLSLFIFDRYGFVLVASYAVILLIDTLTKAYGFNGYLHNIGVLLGIASVLFATKAVIARDKARKTLLWLSSCSFFVFAVHEPLITVARKISFKLFTPDNDVIVLLFYFLIPTLVIIGAVLLYMVLKSLTPKFLKVISGGREHITID